MRRKCDLYRLAGFVRVVKCGRLKWVRYTRIGRIVVIIEFMQNFGGQVFCELLAWKIKKMNGGCDSAIINTGRYARLD